MLAGLMVTKGIERFVPASDWTARMFDIPPIRLAVLLSLTWSAWIFLPAWVSRILVIPRVDQFPHSKLGILMRPNWSLTYPLALPFVFGIAAYLNKAMRLASERLSWPENKIILTADGAVPGDYQQTLVARITARRPYLFVGSFLLTVIISIADTADVWRGGWAYLHGRAHCYPEWDWSVAYSLSPTMPTSWRPPSFTANMVADLFAYTAQASVIFLGFFWVGSYWLFLKNVSDLMIPKDAPYRFNPMWNDPDSKLGLAPLGRVYNWFLNQTLVFQIYIFGHRLQQLRWRGGSQHPIQDLFQHSADAWRSFDWIRLLAANGWSTIDTGTWFLLCAIGIPTIIISYLPLFRLKRYIQERRDEEWLHFARKLNDATEKGEWDIVYALKRKKDALKNACVWPNGEFAGWFLFLTTCCLSLTCFLPSLAPAWLLVPIGFTMYKAITSRKELILKWPPIRQDQR